MRFLFPDVRFGIPNFIQRLALLIWWLFLGLAVLAIGIALFGISFTTKGHEIGPIFVACAVASWAVGRTMLFLLTGR